MQRFVIWFAALLFAASPAVVRAQDEERPLHRSLYPVINVHRHLEQPDEQALKVEFEVMDRVGVKRVVILDGKGSDSRLPAWIQLRKKYPERLIVFGNMPWSRSKQPTFFADLVREVEAQHRLGVQGIKVWKDLGMYIKDADGKLLKADDTRLDPFWAKCAELGLPVLYHIADPREYWYPRTFNSFHYGMTDRPKHYEDAAMPKWEELMRQRDSILKKHPKLKFIGAHMGSQTFDLQGLSEALDRYPNFHVECAARLRILGRLNPQAVRDFFIKYQDRVLFGTDSEIMYRVKPGNAEEVKRWQDKASRFYSRHLEYFDTGRPDIVEPYGHASEWLRLAGVRLPAEVQRKFYHANAERLIPGIALAADAPKPIPGVGPVSDIVKLPGDFKFTEGPAADAKGNLYFTDIPNNRIHKLDLDRTLTTFLEDSKACNGLMFDGRGRLLACQGGEKRVIALDVATKKIMVIADKCDGKPLDVPNDLVVDRAGGVYFTDPAVKSVYYAAADGKVTRLLDDLARPNGVILSPDEKTLYVLPSGSAEVMAYPVESPGKIGKGRVLCKLEQNPEQPKRLGGDGLTVDAKGNLYLTKPSLKAIQVVSPEGKTLGLLTFPDEPANCTFGGSDMKTLFVTARTSLYAVRMEATGHRFPGQSK